MFFQHRTPRRFGWMCCNHRANFQLAQYRLQIRRRDIGFAQGLKGVGERTALRRVGRVQFVPPFAANAMILLGDVGQLKVHGKRANHANRFVQSQTTQQLLELLFDFWRMLCAQLFAQGAHLFLNLKQAFAAEPFQGFAQQIAEPMDVFTQRQIFRQGRSGFGFVHR